jgi:hypothetical protein
MGYEAYRDLLQRLEDLEDLRAMREAETEYRVRDGRPFSEIVAELETEEEEERSCSGHHQDAGLTQKARDS